MSKELDAFKKIAEIHGNTGSLEGTYEYFLTIKRGLMKLEAIENAEPNEALELLKELRTIANMYCSFNSTQCEHNKELADIIKQALLKSQVEHNALEIIKEKCVGNDNLYLVKETIDYKHYSGKAQLGIDNIVNINLKEKDLLIEEEFNVLKEVVGCTE